MEIRRKATSGEGDAVDRGRELTAARGQLSEEVTQNSALFMARALNLTRDRIAAWDLFQDTVVQGLRALTQFRAGSNMRGWLLRIMYNLHVDRCRRQNRHTGWASITEDIPADEPEPTPRPLPTREDLDQAITRLAPPDRQIVLLRGEKRLSCKVISRELGISPNTVATRFFRAKQRLRAMLGVDSVNGPDGSPP
jgi:RNA polymerase sigma-70 factor (ECF subfamily)